MSERPHGAVFKFGSDTGFAGGDLRRQVMAFAEELNEELARCDESWKTAIVFSGAVALGKSMLPGDIHQEQRVARRVRAAFGQTLIQRELTSYFV